MTLKRRIARPFSLLVALAVAGCTSSGGASNLATGLTGASAAGVVTNNAGNLIANNAGGLVANNSGGLVANNAAGLVSVNSGGLSGVILGPAAGLIANNAAGLVSGNLSGLIANNAGGLVSNNSGGLVSNNSGGLVSNNAGGLVSNNAGGYTLLATGALTAPVGNATVTVVDEHDQPLTNVSVTSDATGAYSILTVGPSHATIYVKASFQQEGQTCTLLAATAAPRAAVQMDVQVDPASSLVAKKTSEAAAAGTLDPDKIDAQTLAAMAAQVRPLMSGKAIVAAGLGNSHQGSQAFDAMLHQSPQLSEAVTSTAARKGLGAIAPAPPGPLTVLAGGSAQGFVDGAGTSAQFSQPYGLANQAGVVYVSEVGNHRIRKVSADGTVSTFAGSGTAGFLDGQSGQARFNSPRGLALDAAGNTYVADAGNHRIRKIDPTGLVTTLAGSGTAGFADGAAGVASFNSPRGLALDANGNLYVADTQNFRIRKIDPKGNVSTLAGTGTQGFADGKGASASFVGPLALAIDPTGNVLVADYSGHRVRKITPDGTVSTLVGDGTPGSQDGAKGQLKYPAGLAIDAAGVLYIADSGNNAIRQLGKDGLLTSLAAGTPVPFNGPYGLTVGADGTLYVADTSNQRVCKLAH
jgi:sugar lactone lactonase YvrE